MLVHPTTMMVMMMMTMMMMMVVVLVVCSFDLELTKAWGAQVSLRRVTRINTGRSHSTHQPPSHQWTASPNACGTCSDLPMATLRSADPGAPTAPTAAPPLPPPPLLLLLLPPLLLLLLL
jgi:hypothetical protein